MNVAPLATDPVNSLAEMVDEVLADVLAGRGGRCLWCGGTHVAVSRADIWSGRVTIVCRECGSELAGVVPRSLREVPR